MNLPLPLIDWLIRQDNLSIAYESQGGGADDTTSEHSVNKELHDDLAQYNKNQSFFKQICKPNNVFIDISKPYYHNKIVSFCLAIALSPIFDTFILVAIILNTIVLSLDGYPTPEKDILVLYNYSNQIFTLIFFLEVVIKMIGFSLRVYVKDKFNQFDFLVVVMSFV